MKAIAIGLGVDDDVFLSRVNKAFWNLRILGYEGRSLKSSSNAGIGQHTGQYPIIPLITARISNCLDFGILTFLLTDSTKQSLQVLDKTGEWLWADPIEVSTIQNPQHFLPED
jgi:isopenicillin N synthase-like dioxygenase